MKKILTIILVLATVAAWAGLTKAGYIENYFGIDLLCSEGEEQINKYDPIRPVAKPVIYLYSQEIQPVNVSVRLNFQGTIIAEYPESENKSWNVTAYPDGHLINEADKKEYSYLFWEGKSEKPINWDLSTGFVVKGEDSREFLQEKLSQIGLIPKEYNEFIVYWYPKMKDNKYNLVHFTGEQYTKTAPLEISPKPDSMLRVFMVFKPLEDKIDIPKQQFKPFERKGFTVVEWGGMELQ